jgi:cholesterol 7-dehydrogenase
MIGYTLYFNKYRYYIFKQKSHFTKGKHPIGRTIPNYPNGWFRILASKDLKEKEVKYINAHGESLAVFRGEDKMVYALDAYCAHLGANLGVEGNVVNSQCIQCPFHGWTFDGKTGNCVVGKDMKPKEAFRYEYEFSSSEEKMNLSRNERDCNFETFNNTENENENSQKNENDCDLFSKNNKNFDKKNNIKNKNTHENLSFTQGKKEIVKIRKYQTLEKSGSIFVWFNATDSLKYNQTRENTEYIQSDFPYEPFDLSEYENKLEYRGTSLNTVNSHLQDVAENGGDLLHFLYIHNQLIPFLVRGYWDAKWIRGSDPELKTKLTLQNDSLNTWRNNLLDKYLTEKNKDHIGVIALENSAEIVGVKKDYKFFCVTGFQVGPGLVYLFLKSDFFEILFMQYIESKDKFHQNVYHDIYTSKYMPYWFSALLLRLEVLQVLNDGVVWDNKRFGIKPYLNPEVSPADRILHNWRQWFSQFYTDCKKYEEYKKQENLDW